MNKDEGDPARFVIATGRMSILGQASWPGCACVDVNEFGWLIGWVMECYEGDHHQGATGRH
ncbi:MAG: hypothetical protein U0531_21800 [Dehalococcoidia bacterium]